MTTQLILAEAEANLGRGRAIATGIGVFLVVVNEKGDPLLRRRLEKDSLYGQDLSGKWEMTGGGMEIEHFDDANSLEPRVSRYLRPLLRTLTQELQEEAGLLLTGEFPVVMVPAVLKREYNRKTSEDLEDEGEPRISIDLAFSIPAPISAFEAKGESFQDLIEQGKLMFVPRDKLGEIEIVSPRTRFLIEQALALWDMLSS